MGAVDQEVYKEDRGMHRVEDYPIGFQYLQYSKYILGYQLCWMSCDAWCGVLLIRSHTV
jgi:hypothetical protein